MILTVHRREYVEIKCQLDATEEFWKKENELSKSHVNLKNKMIRPCEWKRMLIKSCLFKDAELTA